MSSPDVDDKNTSAPQQRIATPNRFVLVLGLFIFVVSSGLVLTPRVVDATTIEYPMFVACVGLGMMLYSVGGEAKVTNKFFTITGAGAVAVILFFTLDKAVKDSIKSAEPKYKGSLIVRAADPRVSLALIDPSEKQNPIKSYINFNNMRIEGTLKNSKQIDDFEFVLNGDAALQLKEENCPDIYIEFANGHRKYLHFTKSRMIPADYNSFFQIEYIVDRDKLYYRNGAESVDIRPCNASADLIDRVETNIAKVPPAGETRESDTRTPSASPPASSPTSSSPPASSAPPSSRPSASLQVPVAAKVVGYVIVAQLSSDFKEIKKSWFDIESKPNSRFPSPNDYIIANRDKIPVYPEPYHWDETTQKHVVPASFMRMSTGQRAKVGGDALIARDENNGAQYVISPIIEIDHVSTSLDKPFYPPVTLPEKVKGYVYIGYLDESGSAYADKTFKNYTKPDALYPSPGDILVATTNVWLRAGPRRWDPEKQAYVNGETVTPIKAGQYVRVGGDTVLAKGGTSVWAPVTGTYDGLSQMAGQQP